MEYQVNYLYFFINPKINFTILDKRTRGWLLVDTPWPTLLSTMVYLGIVWYGPRLMKDRKPFRLTWALIPYNLAMAALNAFIAFEVQPFLYFFFAFY